MSPVESTLRRAQRCDESLCLWMNGALRYAVLLQLFRGVSRLGDGILWYALMLALLLAQGEAALPAVLHMIAVGLACTLVYKLLKRGTVRPRPYQALGRVLAGAAPLDAYSFPSGHTLHAVAFTLVVVAYYPGLALPLAAFTLLTAASRIVLGLHYPSDVLAGAALGAGIAGASFLA